MRSYCRKLKPWAWKSETHESGNTDSEIYEKDLYDIDKLSLDNNDKEWHKRVFERKAENIYDIKSLNNMNSISK